MERSNGIPMEIFHLQNTMIIFSFAKRVRDTVFSFYYQLFLFLDIFKKSENDMMWVIYVASFISSRSAEK